MRSAQGEDKVAIGQLKVITNKLNAEIVPRRENDAVNATQDAAIKVLQDRLNELRRDTYQTVTVGDEIKRLQNDIAELRKTLMNTGK